jgi:hypothetical protein
MQKLFLVLAVMMAQIGLAQTAVNFTCNDCFGANHDLFSELDAGKVIVICWVEPCGGCSDASLIASSLVESFHENYPDKVYMYLADDYADTDCASLISWANMFGIHPTTFFSDSSVDMFDYGEPGMPKVVVVAGLSHSVYYNANFTIDSTELAEAINTAIMATSTGIEERKGGLSSVNIFPNPAKKVVSVSFYLKDTAGINTEILDQSGRIVFKKAWNGLSEGLNTIEIDLASIQRGVYFLKLNDGINTNSTKIVVAY